MSSYTYRNFIYGEGQWVARPLTGGVPPAPLRTACERERERERELGFNVQLHTKWFILETFFPDTIS